MSSKGLLSTIVVGILLVGCAAEEGAEPLAEATPGIVVADGDASALAPASGGDPAATLDPSLTGDVSGETIPSAVADPDAARPDANLPAVDRANGIYVTCVVGASASSYDGSEPADDVVEMGIDRCRNDFRRAVWAYEDTGASPSESDRFARGLLSYAREQARAAIAEIAGS